MGDTPCPACGQAVPPTSGPLCSPGCVSQAERELQANAVELRRLGAAGDHPRREALTRRNASLMEALLGRPRRRAAP